MFSNAKTTKAANTAISKARGIVANSSSGEIKALAKFVLEDNRKMFRDIICRLDVQSVESEAAIEEEIRDVFRSGMVSESLLDAHKNHCLGWLVSKISKEIREKRTPIIEYNEFYKENVAFCREMRTGVLADYSKGRMPDKTALLAEGQSDKIYVRQLQAIDISGEKLLQACSDFYKAGINRQMWIDCEMVSAEAAADFEERLCSAYENERERIELSQTDTDDIHKGKLLLNACERQQERLAGMEVVDRTIPGTYHHLSDDLRLGWHPQWKEMFPKKEDEEA
jgi:hypothetical protein